MTKMTGKGMYLKAFAHAAEDMVAVTGVCPYRYLGCDDTYQGSKLEEFIKIYLPWCDRNSAIKVDGHCIIEAAEEDQLTAWKACWTKYWENEDRHMPPAWCKEPALEKVVRPQTKVDHGEGEVCPRCEDGALVRRESEHGPFWGCTNFPECHYTAQIKDENKPEQF